MSETKQKKEWNTLIAFVGQTGKKSFKYQIQQSSSSECKTGDTLSFDKKVIAGISVGSVILCNTTDGQSFGSFKWAMSDQREFFVKYHQTEITRWSADERVFLENQKIERANKLKSDCHIDQLIADVCSSTKYMTTREKLQLINHISNQILISKSK